MQTIIVAFNDSDAAFQARQELLAAGFSDSEVRLESAGGAQGAAQQGGVGGFFRNLFGGSDDSRPQRYAASVAQGQSVLAVDTDSDISLMRAVGILDRYDPVDLNERAAQQQPAYPPQADLSRSAMGGAQMASQHAQPQPAPQERPSYADTRQEQQAIPVVQEELHVGKREVDRGRFRVVQRVVETPVRQNVNLREERLEVERHPVNRPVEGGDATGLFQEGSFEVRARAEMPVVQKSARVVEEVVIGTQVTEHQEQIRDTLRHTEVEVKRLDGTDGHDERFHQHWSGNYGAGGGRYDEYAPAYRYGMSMAGQYQGRRWDEVEARARADWEAWNPQAPWAQFQDAVREGWDRGQSTA